MWTENIARTLALLYFMTSSVAFGQAYPSKPIRMITSQPGAAVDIAARLVAQDLSKAIGQAVYVENHGGAASGAIAGRALRQANPDGYTLMVHSDVIWIAPLLMDVPYDIDKDFLPITVVTTAPNGLVVHPSLPVKTVNELVALAKAKPGALNYGVGSIGAPTHLGGELFKSLAGVNIVRVHYKGGGPTLAAVLAGQVQIAYIGLAAALSNHKSGRLRLLGITSEKPSTLAPGVPTIASSLPGYEALLTIGLFAPGKTPVATSERIWGLVVKGLKTPEVIERYRKVGQEAVGNTSAEFSAYIKANRAQMGKVLKEADK